MWITLGLLLFDVFCEFAKGLRWLTAVVYGGTGLQTVSPFRLSCGSCLPFVAIFTLLVAVLSFRSQSQLYTQVKSRIRSVICRDGLMDIETSIFG